MDQNEIKYFLEAALLAAGRPLNIDQLRDLFDGRMAPEKAEIRAAIETLNDEYKDRGIVVSEVASGYRMQVKSSMADRLSKLWEERPPRYSRALFETLALIAYRQPITRGEIEEVRGVPVSSNITRQLLERDWVRVVGHRDIPGRPAMFGTTKGFLDYFSLKKLDDLPPLADLADWESLRLQLNLPEVAGTDGSDDLNMEEGQEPDADIADLPVLYPEDDSDSLTEDSGADELESEDVDAVDESSVDESFEDGSIEDEELAVSKWPQPVG
ncbi:MAG: SMC-Scp complex subunit ScpB [Gammaproteobacteria bacterium]|nr:SMC-Scp complex subunit ScpB [Gammaproteobacteria bacterium]MDH5240613.1 SMC-Scp complex subunit ScpB [Gammaproteobacteria bacterium]MDH5582539.1 SMC-Scp complex subunit ScpB [Gammaproteobacteria bacterium]